MGVARWHHPECVLVAGGTGDLYQNESPDFDGWKVILALTTSALPSGKQGLP
jgi:hypothetical protein